MGTNENDRRQGRSLSYAKGLAPALEAAPPLLLQSRTHSEALYWLLSRDTTVILRGMMNSSTTTPSRAATVRPR